MEKAKFIEKCPICSSSDILQNKELTIGLNGEFTYVPIVGSYCKDCGVKFEYNTKEYQWLGVYG